ncbi:MAG: metal ABC transporter permease [Synergistetes bacterium]|nr:metal ABC transporter permease [Synergistota bacterium]
MSDILRFAIVASLLAGISCSILGVFVVRMKLTSVGFATSHAAFAGAAISLFFQSNPLTGALIASLFMALTLGPLSEKAKLHAEIILGVLFNLSLALGFIFLSLSPSSAFDRSILSLLWGSVLGITHDEIIILVWILGIIVGVILLFFKEFEALLISRRLAEAAGIDTKPFFYTILFMIAIVVAVSLRLVGGFLIYTLLVVPPASALQFCNRIRTLFWMAPLFSIFAVLGGVFLSFKFDFPLGSSIALLSAALFFGSVLLSPKRYRVILRRCIK